MKKLIFGCGYLGQRVANRWVAAGHEVFAVTRSAQRTEFFRRAGIVPIVANLLDKSTLGDLPQVDTVLFAVGYDRTHASSATIHQVYVEGLRNALAAVDPELQRFIYISSTGVFGSVAGDRVDESSPCEPTREGGQACLAAEQLLTASDFQNRSLILRLAGIYGPGRLPLRTAIAAGQPVAAPSNGWLNLIHVDDAATIVELAERAAPVPRMYLVSDGQPVVRADYYRHLAKLLNAPEPQFISPPADSPAAARAASDKRVDNSRLQTELHPRFAFPSYRAGLAAIVAGEQP